MLICLFFKFSAHSSVVLKLHKFSYFLVFLRQLFYMKTYVPPPRLALSGKGGITSCVSPFTELQCILRIWCVSSVSGGGGETSKQIKNNNKELTTKKK